MASRLVIMPLSYRKEMLTKCSLKLKNKEPINNINQSHPNNPHQEKKNSSEPVMKKFLTKTSNKINQV